MNVHKNAKLTPAGRAVLVKRIEAGERVGVVAREMGVSRRTVYKWLKRFREEGEVGLRDRSSRPHLSPAPDPAAAATPDRAVEAGALERSPDRRPPGDAGLDGDSGGEASRSEPAGESGAPGAGGALRTVAAGVSGAHGHQETRAHRAPGAPDRRGPEQDGEGGGVGVLPRGRR